MKDRTNKRYYSLSDWCLETYGEKLYKLPLDIGCTCPNRDGHIGGRGCIFCSQGGSGDFASSCNSPEEVSECIKNGKLQFAGKKAARFIPYFQSYSNTYGDPERLAALYEAALKDPDSAGISIATRPDCLPDSILSVLDRLNRAFPDKFIWIELGLQTIHKDTAKFIRRGYDLSCFENAVTKLTAIRLPVIAHLILGLPGETTARILESVSYLNALPVWGVKLQLLHVLSGTDLESHYLAGEFSTFTMEEYIDLLLECIRTLSPDKVIHRITGDGPKDLLIAPKWSENKRMVLNEIHKAMRVQDVHQGDLYLDSP